jgi:hypothetical protein
MVNGKYNAVIPCLTRLSNLFAWLAKNPLKEEIPAFAGMTSKKNSPPVEGCPQDGVVFLNEE